MLVLVLVLDSKRVSVFVASKSRHLRSENLQLEPPYQPFEHEDGHEHESSWLLFCQIERRVVLYVIRVHQDTVDRLFFVFSGLAGLEELVGLFHR